MQDLVGGGLEQIFHLQPDGMVGAGDVLGLEIPLHLANHVLMAGFLEIG